MPRHPARKSTGGKALLMTLPPLLDSDDESEAPPKISTQTPDVFNGQVRSQSAQVPVDASQPSVKC